MRKGEVVRYGLAGMATTAVNVAVFALLSRLSMSIVAATAIAWLASVVFSFVANKRFVYRSFDMSAGRVAGELAAFASGRLATGVLDVAVMWLACELMRLPSVQMKLAVNVVVIVANYLLGKIAFGKDRGSA